MKYSFSSLPSFSLYFPRSKQALKEKIGEKISPDTSPDAPPDLDALVGDRELRLLLCPRSCGEAERSCLDCLLDEPPSSFSLPDLLSSPRSLLLSRSSSGLSVSRASRSPRTLFNRLERGEGDREKPLDRA